ncbi:MAG: PEP-CTERM sorting domain-containing protein [Phycisphaera sp.]|nr:PEP-CTERM sorting domain-containing protein [Phycisphaera sp.]
MNPPRPAWTAVIAASVIALVAAPRSHAALVFTAVESGGDVVVTATGSADVSALTLTFNDNPTTGLTPNRPYVVVGPDSAYTDFYTGLILGLSTFGTGSYTAATSGTGDKVGMDYTSAGDTYTLLLPTGYVSGSPLNGSATWQGQTFASLGMTPGSYTLLWQTESSFDSLTLNIGVPEPSSLALLGLGGLLAMRRRRTINSSRHLSPARPSSPSRRLRWC